MKIRFMQTMTGFLTLVAPSLFGAADAGAYEYIEDPSDFATEVIDYQQGGAIPIDAIWQIPFDQPQTAIGRPTVDTTGDDWNMPASREVTVVPIFAPFRMFELVSVGEGGHLILFFDHAVENDPRNPCGVDFIVYGNTSQSIDSGVFWTDGNPNDTIIQTAAVWGEPGVVSVAQSHDPAHPELTVWYTFDNPPGADMFAPTLGRIYDPNNAAPEPPHNGWWSEPTNPLIPLNPNLTAADFQNKTLAEYAERYGYCAGGTGFNLDDVALDWFRYIRIENPVGSGMTPEIDAVADIDPDAAAPDFDCDTDVDGDDLNAFRACMAGTGISQMTSGCERMDIDQDGDIDQTDFGILQRCFSGMDNPADPDCKLPATSE